MALLRTFVGISLLVAAAGCADQGGQMLIVLNNAAPGTGCEIRPVDAGGNGAFIPSGRVDAAGVIEHNEIVGYLLTPSIKNIGDSQGGTLETERTVILQGARVTVVPGNRTTDTGIEPALDATDLSVLTAQAALQFTAPFSGSLAPDGGLAAVAIEVLPRAVVARVGQHVLGTQHLALMTVEVVVFGRTISGGNAESDPFTYPITVCHGCLFTDLGSCALVSDGVYPGGGECNVFQDQPSACCTTTSGLFTCPAVPEVIVP